MLALTLRLLLSLGLVIGLLLMITRWTNRRVTGGTQDLVRVLGRRSLSRNASVSVVMVGSRIMVLGASDQRVEMLLEIEPDELVEQVDFTEYLAEPGQVAEVGPRGLVIRQAAEQARPFTPPTLPTMPNLSFLRRPRATAPVAAAPAPQAAAADVPQPDLSVVASADPALVDEELARFGLPDLAVPDIEVPDWFRRVPAAPAPVDTAPGQIALDDDRSPAEIVLASRTSSALEGSILSADTWRRAYAVARRKYA